MSEHRPFVPDRLRPPQPRRRPRGRLLVLALLPGILVPLPWWKIANVRIDPCPGVPQSVELSLHELEGSSPFALDLQWIRRQVEQWPGVASVQVALELPDTLHVSPRPAAVCGSVRNGNGWRGIDEDGRIGARLPGPQAPVVEVLRPSPQERAAALSVALRLQQATGAQVRRVRSILPDHLEVELHLSSGAPREVVVQVCPTATLAELHWCRKVLRGETPAAWTDLRRDNRVVMRTEAGPAAVEEAP